MSEQIPEARDLLALINEALARLNALFDDASLDVLRNSAPPEAP